MADAHREPQVNPALIARLEYIYAQKVVLSERTFHVLNFFQAVSLAVIAAIVLIFVQWKPMNIDAANARAALMLVIGGQLITTLFSGFSILSSILAWSTYKDEEAAILVQSGYQPTQTPGNPLAWFEWYVVAFVALVSIAIIGSALAFVYPRIGV